MENSWVQQYTSVSNQSAIHINNGCTVSSNKRWRNKDNKEPSIKKTWPSQSIYSLKICWFFFIILLHIITQTASIKDLPKFFLLV